MDYHKALYLWGQCCSESLGVDANGNEVDRVTHLGAVATSHGLELHCLGPAPSRYKIADFLEMWAKAIRNNDIT